MESAENLFQNTFVHTTTLNCLQNGCVSCLYKLFPKGQVSIDSLCDSKLVIPCNVRPETCPRSNNQRNDSESDWFSIYLSGCKLLTVGDGDFSFSKSLLNIPKVQLVATSHESLSSITETYPTSRENISQLKSKGVQVFHEVDATNLTAFVSSVNDQLVDVIIWNFPCIRHEAGADGQVSELDANVELVRRFFSNVAVVLDPNGLQEIHVTHKTCEPFSWWNIVKLGQDAGLTYLGSIVFDRCLYPGYVNRKVLDKKSFPLNDAQTFVFTTKSTKSDDSTLPSSPSSSSIQGSSPQSTLQRCPFLISLSNSESWKSIWKSLELLYDPKNKDSRKEVASNSKRKRSTVETKNYNKEKKKTLGNKK